MSDIVERLRHVVMTPTEDEFWGVIADAADEIDRLRAEVAASAVNATIARLHVAPGDALIASIEDRFPRPEVGLALASYLRSHVPEGVQVIVTSGVKYSVLTAGAEEGKA